ncbi:MAG: Crp/Fnr family transcriptional regulator [Blastocatellia bacterium]
MSKKLQISRRRKHLLSEKTKALSAASLARKIGYLHIKDLPEARILEDLPTQTFSPHRIIRCKDELMLIKQGMVEIWHTHHDYMVKKLEEGMIFGELSLLGQTMLGTRAIVGPSGVTVTVMNGEVVKEWIKANPFSILEKIGRRLAEIETQHYRSSFQLVDSRVAALLLKLAGEGIIVDGLTHGELGEKIGVYRETVTTVLRTMKSDRLIDIGRKTITILDKRALLELSEL